MCLGCTLHGRWNIRGRGTEVQQITVIEFQYQISGNSGSSFEINGWGHVVKGTGYVENCCERRLWRAQVITQASALKPRQQSEDEGIMTYADSTFWDRRHDGLVIFASHESKEKACGFQAGCRDPRLTNQLADRLLTHQFTDWVVNQK